MPELFAEAGDESRQDVEDGQPADEVDQQHLLRREARQIAPKSVKKTYDSAVIPSETNQNVPKSARPGIMAGNESYS